MPQVGSCFLLSARDHSRSRYEIGDLARKVIVSSNSKIRNLPQLQSAGGLQRGEPSPSPSPSPLPGLGLRRSCRDRPWQRWHLSRTPLRLCDCRRFFPARFDVIFKPSAGRTLLGRHVWIGGDAWRRFPCRSSWRRCRTGENCFR